MEANQLLPQVLKHLHPLLTADDVVGTHVGFDGRVYPVTEAVELAGRSAGGRYAVSVTRTRRVVWMDGEAAMYDDAPTGVPQTAPAEATP